VIVQPVRVPRELGPRELGPPSVTDSGDGPGVPAPAYPEPELAMDADPAPDDSSAYDPNTDDPSTDDPSTDEAVSEPATGTTPYPVESLAPAAYGYDADTEAGGFGAETSEVGPALTAGPAEPDDADMPVFHRLFSAPSPPTEV